MVQKKSQSSTKEHFISLAKERRTDIDFDYSKVNYINAKTKITIIDPEFGEFDITPAHFLSGRNHFARGRMVQKNHAHYQLNNSLKKQKKEELMLILIIVKLIILITKQK